MIRLKLCFVFVVLCSSATFVESANTENVKNLSSDVNGTGEGNIRNKRFLFNLLNPFGGNFNSFPSVPRPPPPLTEDEQVEIFRSQNRVLNRVSAELGQNYNSFNNDNFYLQSLLQQRRVRQRYFEETGERLYSDRGYYDNDNYNNYRFRN